MKYRSAKRLSRREFISAGLMASAAVGFSGCSLKRPTFAAAVTAPSSLPPGIRVNDVHSQMNSSLVREISVPGSVDECQSVIREARNRRKKISVAGGRHSMGGQQFADDSLLVDTRGMKRVLGFDSEQGLIEVEAGIEWPDLIHYLWQVQAGRERQWAIVQKQTGADNFTLGGSLASNVHGRALAEKPMIANVESFKLLDGEGELQECSRVNNPELFRLAIGGYGLFGLIASVQLRLRDRVKVRRIVELRDLRDIPSAFEQRIRDGYLYGDFQFATDSRRESFLRRGVFSCYQPVPLETPITEHPTRFSAEDWARLTYYTHVYKRRAFEIYTERYVQTSGQVYWADSQLFGNYLDNYHQELDRQLHARVPATEMITEIDVPRSALFDFMEEARVVMRDQNANLIYGVVRLIEKDDESFLPWARDRYACVVLNLHVAHEPSAIEQAARTFCSLIDLAVKHNGSYYLTYHRFARREQLESCYPQFPQFLALKRRYDSAGTFDSNWYRHYRTMFGGLA